MPPGYQSLLLFPHCSPCCLTQLVKFLVQMERIELYVYEDLTSFSTQGSCAGHKADQCPGQSPPPLSSLIEDSSDQGFMVQHKFSISIDILDKIRLAIASH